MSAETSTSTSAGAAAHPEWDADAPITNFVASALLLARPEFKPLAKSGKNLHFRSQYSTLADILEACLPALTKHGLVLTQPVEDRGGRPWLRTELIHAASGDTLVSMMPLSMSEDPQVVGSDMTYKRRYSVAALLGLEGEWDDDGEAVAEKTTRKPAGADGEATRKGADPGPPAPDRTHAPVPAGSLDPENPGCPNCGGDMWDNREPSRGGKGRFPKKSPKAPDFACKDKGCQEQHKTSKRPSVYWTNEWQKLCAEADEPHPAWDRVDGPHILGEDEPPPGIPF